MVRTVSNQVTNWTTLTTLTMPNNEDPITGQATVTVDPSRVHTLLSVTNLFSSPVIFNGEGFIEVAADVLPAV